MSEAGRADPRSEVALVTGAGSGIGAAIARKLAARGAKVGVLDVMPAGASRTAGELASGGAETIALEADVVDGSAVAAAVDQVEASLGTLTTVVSCAGLEITGTALNTSDERWARALDVNLTGVFHVARHTIPSLVATKGSFCAISSDSGFRGAPSMLAYTAAKHGVIGLIRGLAIDHGPAGVRANAVCPGTVRTPMLERLFESSDPGDAGFYESTVPLGRFAEPDEIAAAVLHLTSPECSYTNGHIYVADGGSSAGYFSPPGG